MKPFLDLDFLLRLTLKSESAQAAWNIVRRFEPPYWLDQSRILNVENFFLHATQEPAKSLAIEGLGTWHYLLSESVLQNGDVDWDAVFRLANRLNHAAVFHHWKAIHFLQAATASVGQFTHFCSFDPKSRTAASLARLRLLPERLEGRV
jgi:hypothetical protein